MIGLVLAAGAGRRLRPYNDTLPKALVPVGPAGIDGEPTVLDLTLGNFAEIGLTEVAIIVGYRKEAVYARKEALERKYGQVWTTDELARDFAVTGFLAPLVVVRRKSDGRVGSLEFSHTPRFYFNWQPHED